jgi:hypothetical protein
MTDTLNDTKIVEPTTTQVEAALTAWFGTEHWTGWYNAARCRVDMHAALVAAAKIPNKESK